VNLARTGALSQSPFNPTRFGEFVDEATRLASWYADFLTSALHTQPVELPAAFKHGGLQYSRLPADRYEFDVVKGTELPQEGVTGGRLRVSHPETAKAIVVALPFASDAGARPTEVHVQFGGESFARHRALRLSVAADIDLPNSHLGVVIPSSAGSLAETWIVLQSGRVDLIAADMRSIGIYAGKRS
jgi:hypothetical protein